MRRARGLSQRELAALSGVHTSTVDRIESGASRAPSFAVVEKILGGAGYRLAVTGYGERLLDVDEPHDRLVDRGGRHYPAHLPLERLRNSWQDPWWGWFRIAWSERDPEVPKWIYHRRARLSWDEYVDWPSWSAVRDDVT